MIDKSSIKAVLSGTKGSVFKNDEGRLLMVAEPDGSYNLLFKDDVIGSILSNVSKIVKGKPRSVLIVGNPGTSKSWLLKVFSNMLDSQGDTLKTTMIECSNVHSIQSFMSLIRDSLLGKKYKSMAEIGRMISLEAKERRLILLIDDIHEVAVHSYKKMMQHVSTMKQNSISIIASSNILLENQNKYWDEIVVLKPYSIDQIKEILKQMIRLNVHEGIVTMDLPISICANHVHEKYASNINHAIRIMELALAKVDRETFLGKREEKVMKAGDIEEAVLEFDEEMKRNEIAIKARSWNARTILLVEMLSKMNKISFPKLFSKYTTVHERLFPGAVPPSERSIREALDSLYEAGIVKKGRADMAGRGVSQVWTFDKEASSHIKTTGLLDSIIEEMLVDEDDN